MPYRLGKKPARPDAVSFRFAAFFNAAHLPTPPMAFGHVYGPDQQLPWGMLANDDYADCVFAGAAHETMIWTNEAHNLASFDDAAVLSDYAAVTGFNPDDPSTDQGTDMQQAASYRRKTGILDAKGQRHKIDSYVALTPGDANQLALAAYLLGAVGVGLRFPESAMNQFEAREPWTIVDQQTPAGGHYVPCVGRNSHGHFLVVTWGRIQAMTPEFYARYCDEAVAYLSIEALTNELSPEGFDVSRLREALRSIPTVS
jgi:hypothetical protein